MPSFRRQILFYLIIALLFFFGMRLLYNSGTAPERIPYNDFIEQVEKDRVKKVIVYGDEIEAELKDGQDVVSTRPADHSLSDLLLEKNILYETNPPRGPSWWQTALTYACLLYTSRCV